MEKTVVSFTNWSIEMKTATTNPIENILIFLEPYDCSLAGCPTNIKICLTKGVIASERIQLELKVMHTEMQNSTCQHNSLLTI